jgi:hypothetical protein
VSDCCTPKGYRQIFSEKNAAGEAKRYRRKGLDGTSKRIFDFIREGGVEGKTLLEVGGGIGAIEIELLKAGMARAINVELTPTYEAAARELLVEAGLTDQVERRVIDWVAERVGKSTYPQADSGSGPGSGLTCQVAHQRVDEATDFPGLRAIQRLGREGTFEECPLVHV